MKNVHVGDKFGIHSPGGKKKTHHAPDYVKDKDADDILKGSARAVPDNQWEMHVDLTPPGDNTPYGAFNPRSGKSRSTVYTKTNECDH